MDIPISNIYYLLCYAWNKLDEKEIVEINADNYNSLIDLLTKVLTNGTSYLLKRGLDRDYIEVSEKVNGVKGKMDISSTIKHNLLVQKKTICEYDEFDYDILHNQIVKSTLENVLRISELNRDLKHEVWVILKRFPKIKSIPVKRTDFQRIRLDRNNSFYDFLLNVCYIINENIKLDESDGKLKFKEFDRDDKKMPYLFESFVRNFFQQEQKVFTVSRDNIRWKLMADIDGDEKYLPIMQTDISLKSTGRKIIIDTKYYKEILKNHFSKEEIISGNLYQIYAYLKNQENPDDKLSYAAEGILLYPAVDKSISKSFRFESYKITIHTINLNQEWRRIHDDLLEILR